MRRRSGGRLRGGNDVITEGGDARPRGRTTPGHGAKRAIDVILSVTLLMVLAPLWIVIVIAILATDGRPVLYRAERAGYRGARLSVLKFRKLRKDARGLPLTISEDDRFTTIGRALARWKLDEIPQLVNVVLGQMSLVGPRPEDGRFVALYEDEYRHRILTVRPGITGLCQLAFAKEGRILDPADRIRDYEERILPQKVAIDCLYVERRSVRMDLGILAWTLIATVLRRDLAVNRRTGGIGIRRRPDEGRGKSLATAGVNA